VVLPLTEYQDGFRPPGSLLITVIEEPDDAPTRSCCWRRCSPTPARTTAPGWRSAVRITEIVGSGHIGRKAPSLKVSYYIGHPEAPGV
jgi:hypothetical protein